MRLALLLLALLSVVASPLFAAAGTSNSLRDRLLRADALVRNSQRPRTAPPLSDDIVDIFRDDPATVTVAACSKAAGSDLSCAFNSYSLHALSASNVDDLQLLGGESIKSVFALAKSTDLTVASDFAVFCYAAQFPPLFVLSDASPFANTSFDRAFRGLLDARCKDPSATNAKALLKDALPLLAKTCQIESDGTRRQTLKNTGENTWSGQVGDCDSARFDLTYEKDHKNGALTRTPVAVKDATKCEDVFGDPLEDKDDGGSPPKHHVAVKPSVSLHQGLFDASVCDHLRWSETFPFLTVNLDSGRPKKIEGGDPRYEAAVNALFAGDYDVAQKGLNDILKHDAGNGLAHLALGVAKERQGQVGPALASFSEALKTLKNQPIGHSVDGRVVAYLHRGATQYEHGKPQEALKDFEMAAALEPTSFDAHYWAAAALAELKRDKDAIAAFRRALSLRESFDRITGFVFGEFGDTESMLADFVTPPAEEMLTAAAWRLAVTKESAVRDGAQAAQFAKKAVELTDGANGRYLDTLAVAYAAAGQMKEAQATEEKAIEQLTAEGADKDERAGMEKRLALYKVGQIYTE